LLVLNKDDIYISASLMCADLYNLDEQIITLDNADIDFIHYDVMDGHFVPNLGLGIELFKTLKNKINRLKIDTHLMVSTPEKYIPTFGRMGSDIITFHAETCNNLYRNIELIKSYNSRVGIALNPATPISNIKYVLEYIDVVLIMTVEPGFSGQKFIPSMLSKISELKKIILDNSYNINIEVDGNINSKIIPLVVKAGANILVGGSSSLFQGDKDLKLAAKKMRQASH
jgi:ribulose-phosphate 3-epimerase